MSAHKTNLVTRRWLPLVMLGFLALSVSPSAAPRDRSGQAKLTVTTKSYGFSDPWIVHPPPLNDLSQSGLMLFDFVPDFWALEPPKFWSLRPLIAPTQAFLGISHIGQSKLAFQIEIPKMWDWARQAGYYGDVQPGPFKFSPDSKSAIGIQMPWLVVVSLQAPREVRRLQPCERQLLSMRRPSDVVYPDEAQTKLRQPRTVDYPPTPGPGNEMRMAISPRDGIVAAGCVVKGGSELVVVDPELKGALNRWFVPRPIQDLAWSPDGKELAVLYYDPPYPWDPKTGKWVGPPSPYPVAPNVSIFDPRSGKELLRLNTSSFDAKIGFSPEGGTLYSISDLHFARGYGSGDWGKEHPACLRREDGRNEETHGRAGHGGSGELCHFAGRWADRGRVNEGHSYTVLARPWRGRRGGLWLCNSGQRHRKRPF